MEMEHFLLKRYRKLAGRLDERTQRLMVAADCAALGRGAISRVARACGLSRPTFYRGLAELKSRATPTGRIRRAGGGRKPASEKYPQLREALERLVSPTSRGDPMSPLRWTTLSTRKLAAALGSDGCRVSHRVVAETLAAMGYSLQANAKALEEGSQHPDRDEQFAHLNQQASKFMAAATAIGCDCGNGNCNT